MKRLLGSLRYRHQQIAVMALIGDIMRHDQMRLRIHGGLDIVAHHAAVPRARGHGAGIGIVQGDLAVRRIGQCPVHRLQMLDVLPHAAIALGQMCHLLGADLALFLPIDPDHLRDVAFDVRLEMGDVICDLALGEVANSGVHRPELAAVDSDACALQHADASAKLHEPGAGTADAKAIVAAEVGDGLVVGNETASQPHQLDIAARFAFEPAARRDPVQVAINKQLEQNGGGGG